MKYETRIISEEDTIKSKPYEDLDKAIEIADSIYQNFVNSDFGDEIVVVEENSKDKKYYWANGKTLERPLKIGDKVKIINKGETYTTYEDFMTAHATKELCCRWNMGTAPKNYEDDPKIYTIKELAMHEDNGKTLAIIEDEYAYYLSVYIIGTRGLQLVE